MVEMAKEMAKEMVKEIMVKETATHINFPFHTLSSVSRQRIFIQLYGSL
jgi:hypothetical protein